MNTKNASLVYSSGGQFPHPILYDGQSARFLRQRNLPVGLFEQAAYSFETLHLPDAFVLAMLSDGILEILNHETLKDKELFLLEQVNNMSVSMDALINVFELNAAGAPLDDITLLLVKKGA